MLKKQKVVYFLILIIINVSFIGCDSDDNEESIVKESFLKKYSNTKWKHIRDNGQIDVYKFNDSELNPFDVWFKQTNDKCYYYFQSYKRNYEIIENSEDTLVVAIQFNPNSTRTTTITFWVDEKNNINVGPTRLSEITNSNTLVICN